MQTLPNLYFSFFISTAEPEKKLYVSYSITNNYANPIKIKTNSTQHPPLPLLTPGETRSIQFGSSATVAIRVFDALSGRLQTINGRTVAYLKPNEDRNFVFRLYVPYEITGTCYLYIY
jgi:hypothetical protein